MELHYSQSLANFRCVFFWLQYHVFLVLSKLMLLNQGQRILHAYQQKGLAKKFLKDVEWNGAVFVWLWNLVSFLKE